MSHRNFILQLIAAATVVIAAPVSAQQLGMAQGTEEQHLQHMTQMHDMMRQMSDMAQRSTQMQQQMKRHMAGHMQSGEMSAGHMAMPQIAGHLSGMATQMKRLGEQMETMMKDRGMMADPAMHNGMDGMHEHMAAMSRDMGKMLESMETMHKAMGASAPGTMKH